VVDTGRRDVALLFRRFAFGATAEELDAAVARGYDATVEQFVGSPGRDAADDQPVPTLSPDQPLPADASARKAAQQRRTAEAKALVDWWLGRMVASTTPAREKLSWFWHAHFATAISKVQSPALMYGQNELFRKAGSGPFIDLVQAVAKNPAMLIWLDSNSNVKAHPNENFARELMELFTLGIGSYSEDDVKEAARCFTGWSYNRDAQAFLLRPERHDNATKNLLGHSGNFGGEDAIGLIVASEASTRFVTARVWSHFAFPIGPDDPIVTAITATKPATVSELLRAVAQHPQFRSDAAFGGLVKQPVEWLVGALRALHVVYDPKFGAILPRLGQVPFDPPSVAGWPQNLYWVSTASALGRLAGAAQIAGAADLRSLNAVPASQRTSACARLLGVDAWSAATTRALDTAAGDARSMVALALVSPEFVLN
jgi:uncharacterized protein (DUF1800 family)